MTITHRLGSYEIVSVSKARLNSLMSSATHLITDENVRLAQGDLLPSEAHVLSLPPGEESKSLKIFGECLSWLAQARATRKTVLVAFGGGVIGDLVGYAAASYMRGISFVQVPTTLLSMVDSSVGGKVGVDLPEGKNLAGAFHAPVEVWVCPELLGSLPARQITNGMAEVLKYGFIMAPEILDESVPSPALIERCIDLKRQVVEADEFETNGIRATLNFGHTIGHAIERVTGYGPVLHGEAISIGMALEALLGEQLGISPTGTYESVRSRLEAQGLPITHSSLNEQDDLISAMQSDKKAEGGHLAFSLLTGIGSCKLVKQVPESAVRAVLNHR